MMKRVIPAVLMAAILLTGILKADPFSNPMDFNNDRRVNYEDFAVFVANWLWSAPDPNQFAYIPAGQFEMGDHHDGMSFSLPVHSVYIDSFYMGKFEITNQQYADFLNSAKDANDIKVDGGVVYTFSDGSNSYPYCNTHSFDAISQIDYSGGVFSVKIKDGTTDMSDHPMVHVSWYGSLAYCNWKSLQEGYSSCYDLSTWQCDFTKAAFRLPTEAEWEYAARGGEHSPYYRYPWSDTIDGSMANFLLSGDPYETGAYPYTTPVGYYNGGQTPSGTDMANGYGLYDMAGNVWDWCNDWWDSNYYSTSPYDNPQGPAGGTVRVLRGGYWGTGTSGCRVAVRYNNTSDYRYGRAGFRVVLDLN
jgi:sulfatase modifying factor 1